MHARTGTRPHKHSDLHDPPTVARTLCSKNQSEVGHYFVGAGSRSGNALCQRKDWTVVADGPLIRIISIAFIAAFQTTARDALSIQSVHDSAKYSRYSSPTQPGIQLTYGLPFSWLPSRWTHCDFIFDLHTISLICPCVRCVSVTQVPVWTCGIKKGHLAPHQSHHSHRLFSGETSGTGCKVCWFF